MNDNLAVIGEQEEGFLINNDKLAEWALKKLSEEKAESQRMVNICLTFIGDYQFKIEQYNKTLESKTAYLKEQLRQYFESVPHKESKTQETYKLPSGILKKKFGTPEFKVDNEKLVKSFKDLGLISYIKTEEKAQWGEFKKIATISSDKVLTTDGEIVDGVTVSERPDTFEIEV